MDLKKKVKITVTTGTGLYYYTGFINDLREDIFLDFEDTKEGEILLVKNNIVKIQLIS